MTPPPRRLRRLITNCEKNVIVQQYNRVKDEQSIAEFCRNNNIQRSQLHRWERNYQKIAGCRSTALSSHSGPSSCLANVEEDLLDFICKQRQAGLGVSVRMVLHKAELLSPLVFNVKSKQAKDSTIRRFLKAHRYVFRIGTRTSQRHPDQVTDEALDFICCMRPLIAQPIRDNRFILNMDQTPIFFNNHANNTLDQIGVRTVPLRSGTSSTMRVTVAVTATAGGQVLTPLIVFKGQPNGLIQRKFPQYPEGSMYACQSSAWMDEKVMLLWVE